MRNLVKRPHVGRFLLALVAGLLAVGIYVFSDAFKTAPATGAAGLADENAQARLGTHSIAVFAKPSSIEPDLSFGSASEIIDILASSSAIDVVAASSSQRFESRRDYARAGRVLGVSWILEWRLRYGQHSSTYSATLFRADSEDPVWKSNDKWANSDLAGLIEHVANNVVIGMGLNPRARDESNPVSSRAYAQYLEALGKAGTSGGGLTPELLPMLDKVIEKEPYWPKPQLLYADLLLQDAAGQNASSKAELARAREMVSAYLHVTPRPARAFRIESNIAYRFDWAWKRALECARAALALAPGDAKSLAAAADAAFSLGDFEASIQYIEHAIRIDPLVLNHRIRYARALEYAGRNKDSIEAYRHLMAIRPDYPGVHASLGRALLMAGRVESAQPFMEVESSSLWRIYGLAMIDFVQGESTQGDDQLRRFIADHGSEAAFQVAELQAIAGRSDEALDWLITAIRQRDRGISGLVGNPAFGSLKAATKWHEVLELAGHEVPED